MPDAAPELGNVEVRTSIDALVELLKTKGKSELNSLAVAVGTDPKIIERWAKVLESGGMAKISYEFGRMYLEPVTISKGDIQSVKLKLSARQSIFEQNIATQRTDLDKFSERINSMSMEVANVENIYRQRMPEVQQALAELNRAYALVETEQRNVMTIKSNIESTYGEINKRINELSSKIDTLNTASSERVVTVNTAKVNELLKRAGSASAEVDELRKEKDRFFDTLKKSIDAQAKDFARQLDETNKDIEARIRLGSQQIVGIVKSVNDQANVAKETANQISEFRRHSESSKHTLNRARVEFADKYQKLSSNIYKSSKLVEARSKTLLEKINAIKVAFGDVAKLDDTVRGLRSEVDGVSKEMTGIRTELSSMSEVLAALKSATTVSLEHKANILDQIAEESKISKTKLAKAEKRIVDTEKKLGGKE